MENLRKQIKSKLREANFMIRPEELDDIINKLGKDDVVKIVDEGDKNKNNPWAICTDSVGREDKAKYESCVKKVKRQKGISEEDGEMAMAEPRIDVPDLQRDVQKFLDKLELGQFKNIIARIDKPIEKAELLAAFGERIGVPRGKLPILMATLRQTAESVNPRMTKKELTETVIKTIKVKNIK